MVADSAYGSGDTLAALEDTGHARTIKPWPVRPMTDAADPFTIDDFTIDTAAGTATCPAGKTVSISRTGIATFRSRCAGCPMRPRCTRAKAGKQLKVHPRP